MPPARTASGPADKTALYKALEPVLLEMDRRRRGHILFAMAAFVVLALPAGIVSGGYFTMLATPRYATTLDTAAIMFGVIAGTVTFLMTALSIYRLCDNDYRKRSKRAFNGRIAAALGMNYSVSGLFNAGGLHPHYILPPFSRARTEDGLRYTHQGRPVELQEVRFDRHGAAEDHIFNPHFLGGRRGLIIRIPARRRFAVHTLVVPRRLLARDKLQARFIGMWRYERAPFGNPAFNKKYLVMSMAADEAHFVLDPAFIERLFAFERAIGAKSLSFSFRENEILIYADHPHDFLEAGHLLRPIGFDAADRIIDELHALEALLDTLELCRFTGI